MIRSEMALWPHPAQRVVLPPRYGCISSPMRLVFLGGVIGVSILRLSESWLLGFGYWALAIGLWLLGFRLWLGSGVQRRSTPALANFLAQSPKPKAQSPKPKA